MASGKFPCPSRSSPRRPRWRSTFSSPRPARASPTGVRGRSDEARAPPPAPPPRRPVGQRRGRATMDRVRQDGLKKVCPETDNKPPADLAKALEADQMKTIAFPEGSL